MKNYEFYRDITQEQTVPEQHWQSIFKKFSDCRKFVTLLTEEIEISYNKLLNITKHYQLNNIIPEKTLSNYIIENISFNLGFILSRPCVLEMHCAKENNFLMGETPTERFNYFIEKLCEPENKYEFFKKYPLLKDNVQTLLRQTIESFNIFVRRLNNDLSLIKNKILNYEGALLLEKIIPAGDSHCSGKRVMLLYFNKNYKIVYKPRSIKISSNFQKFIIILNKLSNIQLYDMKLIDQEVYGWCEFIEYKKCENENDLNNYFFEIGLLLGISYLLNGSDLHFENIISCGRHPVIVDYECFFSPSWQKHINDISTKIPFVTKSLILNSRSHLRPDFSGIDVGAISIKKNQKSPYKIMSWENPFTDEMSFSRAENNIAEKNNNPLKESHGSNILNYKEQIISGFITIYKSLLNNKSYLEKKLDDFRGCRVRVLLRSTIDYSKILSESFHPTLLNNLKKRKEHFNHLIKDNIRTDHYEAFNSERRDLLEINIPLFWCYSDGTNLFDSNDNPLNIHVNESGLDLSKRILREIISKKDLELQIKLIENSFRALYLTEQLESNQGTLKFQPSNTFNHFTQHKSPLKIAQKYLTELSNHKYNINNQISWLSLNISYNRVWTSEFTTDATLFNGNLGIAITYAAAYKIFKTNIYKEIAHNSMKVIDNHLKDFNTKIQKPVGFYSGLGGCLYSLKLGIKWLEHKNYIEKINKIVQHLPYYIKNDDTLDIISGSAGLIIALYEIREYLNYEKLCSLLSLCVNQILDKYPNPSELADITYHCSTQPLLGFSHGVSGFAYALQISTKFVSDSRIGKWITDGLSYERQFYSAEKNNWPDFRNLDSRAHQSNDKNSVYMTAWCHGATGILLSRIAMKNHSYYDNYIDHEIKNALKNVIDYGFKSDNFCLCHGLMGNFDTLQLAYEHGYVDKAILTKFKNMILNKIYREGISVNYKLNPFETPNLMIGGAGVIYQLIRMIHPTKIPSLLGITSN